ncbi:MAG: hypothetical protein EZS28_001337 [Streblomastix strix]|uniref:Uncharacterized protein n=1 Tax=Streblomastix strix TaxID=222440 RepID=A0A5J4X7C1_9EUKA|nr:MAG: hypothetical protein EZS28_001337 [Streblomastix strix]
MGPVEIQPAQIMQTKCQFVQLVVEPEFEITTTQPWRFRRIVNGFIPTINQSPQGYMRVDLNGRTRNIHGLVALKFIPNDDPELKLQLLHTSEEKGGSYFVFAKDINGMRHKIYYTKFKRFIGLI